MLVILKSGILHNLKRADRKPPISIPSNKDKKRARNKSTFIETKHVQNVIKLKQNFLNNHFQYPLTFFIFLLGIANCICTCFQSIWKPTSFHWCMTSFLNDKQLLKISFVLALDNPELTRTPFFVFIKRGYFQTRKFLLLSRQTSPKDLFEIFLLFVHLYLRQN